MGLKGDPLVGVCWDADRLDLWRVGIKPDPRDLSTEAAKRPERIGWAKSIEPLGWTELWSRYAGNGITMIENFDSRANIET
jgi:hypothetical protein